MLAAARIMGDLDRIAVVSPHLDDAVFGCGDALAGRPGSTVVTLFAGGTPPGMPLTVWDAAAGFALGDDAVACRRDEDERALRLLDAVPVWLPFTDAQYRGAVAHGDMVPALDVALARTGAGTIAIPFGLWHSDHEIAHVVALAVLRRHPELHWLAYEDAIYRTFADA